MLINWDILKKSISNTLNLEEKQLLERWLGQNDRHRQFYETIRKHYHTPPERLTLNDQELNAAWAQFSTRAKHQGTHRKSIWPAVAASIAAAVVVLGIWTLNQSIMPVSPAEQTTQITAGITQAILSVGDKKILLGCNDQDSEWKKFVSEAQPAALNQQDNAPSVTEQIRIEVPKGGEYRLQLPDGTMVWLNAESAIEYPSQFTNSRRAITLDGEAFFEVTHDPTHPFSITTTDHLEINVLGTRFNVNSYPDVEQAQITLIDGALTVSDGATKLVLKPSQQVVFDRAERTLSLHTLDNAAGSYAWTNGIFDFKQQPLTTILSAISKWYNIKIVYDPAVTRHFDAVTLQCNRQSDFIYVMEILEEVTGLHYRNEGNIVYLTF